MLKTNQATNKKMGRFPKSDFTPTPFLQAVFQLVNERLVATKTIPPLFAVSVDREDLPEGEFYTHEENSMGIMVNEFSPSMLDSGKGKDALADMVRAMLKTRPGKEAVLMTEIWAAKPDVPDEIMALVVSGKMSVGQLPEKFKCEGIMYQYYDMTGEKPKNYFGQSMFQRDADGNVVMIEDPEFMGSDDMLRSTGRFTNLAE